MSENDGTARSVGLGGFDWSDPDPAPPAPRRRGVGPGALALRFAALLGALLVVVGTGFAYALTTSVTDDIEVMPATMLDGIGPRPAARATGATGPAVTLLIGSDRGQADSPGDVPGDKADTIMLIRQSGDSSHAEVLSISRDSVVDVPGHGTEKINNTLAQGGVPLVVQTVEGLTGVRVDHVMVVDFRALADITTALGGVTVVNPTTTTDPLSRQTFAAGNLTLQGQRAVAFVRQRVALGNDDIDRVLNQQRLLAAIAAKISTIDVLKDPAQLMRVINTVTSNLTVDATLTNDTLQALLRNLVSTPKDKVSFYLAPVKSKSSAAGGAPVLTLDVDALKAAAQAINTDKPVSLEKQKILGG
ncbi:LCP family protein [Actinokineospora bangkokensis]|uniref:Cell envelope-related transcriptional attenuator domain-containing protein n=1 Tax=Actinokineospora bangkokensis TaxID=1193682 RepID=A0A1Q9LJA5_9PSEU|nr:LCP family protein [Actinokineospora bangkokensis]OLR92118.1 hypothetical protein BJP25_22505 [Actinokineospora bangkokensis]